MNINTNYVGISIPSPKFIRPTEYDNDSPEDSILTQEAESF